MFLQILPTNLRARPIDSLFQSLKTHSKRDTSHVNFFNQIATKFFYEAKQDSTIFYAEIALAESEKIKYNRGKARAEYLLGQANLTKSNYSVAMDWIMKAQLGYEALNDDTSIAKCNMQAGLISRELHAYPEAIGYFQKASKLFAKNDKLKEAALCEYLLGRTQVEHGSDQEGEVHLETAASAQLNLMDSQGYFQTQEALANSFLQTGQFEKAKLSAAKSLHYFTRTNNPSGIAFSELPSENIFRSRKRSTVLLNISMMPI